MLKSLRDDMNSYMPKILAKRRAIAVGSFLTAVKLRLVDMK